jgi:hypothetical protein
VQAPEVSRPERGSLAGAYAGVAFGAADLSRGSFSLPSPFALPSARGEAFTSVFPSYRPDEGITEWGIGWSAPLSITRWRATTDLDYLPLEVTADELIGPWGRMTRGSDGAWYPQGLLEAVRVVERGASLIAYRSDGVAWSFGERERIDNPRGTYAWYLERIDAPTGEATVLSYAANESGRRFVTAMDYGGWTGGEPGTAQPGDPAHYRVELGYGPLPSAFRDLRSGFELVLDRRVTGVRVLARDRDSGELALRWRYELGYALDPWGPAFYLTSVQRVFARVSPDGRVDVTDTEGEGAREPAFRYDYALGSEEVPRAAFRALPELDSVIAQFGVDAIQPHRASLLDANFDGRIDLEHAASQTLLIRTDAGFEPQPLPDAGAATYPPCRPPSSPYNDPRSLLRMRAGDDEPRVVVLEPGWTGSSELSVCSRDGLQLYAEPLAGYWQLDNNTRLVDLNVDHQPDLLRVEPGGYTVLPNDSDAAGYGFGAPIAGALEPLIYANATWVHDLNGDGVPDLVSVDGAQLVVWYGRGNFEFAPQGELLPVEDAYGWMADLSSYDLDFVDANKDGLSDVLASLGFTAILYVNDGSRLVERPVPAFADLDWSSSAPVIADFAASGNAELTITQGLEAKGMQLVSAGTGLLRSADDGKGTRLSFTYTRGPARDKVEYRAAVLESLSVASSGYDEVTYGYEYEQPVAHTAAKYLLGFETARRFGPLAAEEVRFHNDDQVVGVVLGSASTDLRRRTRVASPKSGRAITSSTRYCRCRTWTMLPGSGRSPVVRGLPAKRGGGSVPGSKEWPSRRVANAVRERPESSSPCALQACLSSSRFRRRMTVGRSSPAVFASRSTCC